METNNKYEIKPWLWDYACEVIDKYHMDNSHGIMHFVNVVQFIRKLLLNITEPIIPGLSYIEGIDLLQDAGFVHDLIDGKYRSNENEAVTELMGKFREHGYSEEKINIIVHIITTMSFSKRAKRRKLGLPMIDEGPYSTAVGIVVDADQLDAFDVTRIITYQEEQCKHLPMQQRLEECIKWQKTIMVKRVLRYYDEYMNTPEGKKLAEPLHKLVEDYVASREDFKGVEMYDYP